MDMIFSLFSCGSGGSGADDTDNTSGNSGSADDGTNQSTTSDFRDYTFEKPEVSGNTFYIDPVNGSRGGDGSETNPWLTLQQVIEDGLIQWCRQAESYNPDSERVIVNETAPVQGGDRLRLRSGYHGHVSLNTFIFNDWLTILKDNYEGSDNYWEADEINHNSDACLYLASSSFWGLGRQVKINGLTLGTTADSSAWNAADWVERASGGIGLRSVLDCEIVNCRIANIRHGLTIEYASDNTIAVNNTIKSFSGDGCRLISNNVFLAYNTITDCLKVDDNHDDAIQSYSRGDDNSSGTGVLDNNVVRGNLIIGTTDYSHPLAGSPQGIGCFDGFFDGWVVENNVVIVDQYHGISFYGMRNSHILNNTVIDQDYANSISPWIMITDHKNGTPSDNCTIANNIAYRSISAGGTEVSEHHNYVVGRENSSLLYDLCLSVPTILIFIL